MKYKILGWLLYSAPNPFKVKQIMYKIIGWVLFLTPILLSLYLVIYYRGLEGLISMLILIVATFIFSFMMLSGLWFLIKGDIKKVNKEEMEIKND